LTNEKWGFYIYIYNAGYVCSYRLVHYYYSTTTTAIIIILTSPYIIRGFFDIYIYSCDYDCDCDTGDGEKSVGSLGIGYGRMFLRMSKCVWMDGWNI